MIAELPAKRTNKWRSYASLALALTGVGGLLQLFMRRRFRPVEDLTQEPTLSQPITRLTATGLTEAEAAARFEPGQDKTLELFSQVNWDEDAEESEVQFISGSELAVLEPELVELAAAEVTVFSQVSPQQTEQIVQGLRRSGKAVGVICDGVNDVAAMRQADLALTRRNSSPAALSAADISLLDDSPLVLSRVVDKGQRIVNGLLNVLKIYLTQVCYMLLLVVGIALVAFGFPYSSAQGGLIALITLTIPAVGLSLWAIGGQLHRASPGRELSRFIWPASLTMGLVGLVVYALFLERSDSTEYAQLAVTYTLVFTGLMLVIFIKPPLRFALGSLPVRADLRPTSLVITAALVFIVITYIPLAQRLFEIAPLDNLSIIW